MVSHPERQYFLHHCCDNLQLHVRSTVDDYSGDSIEQCATETLAQFLMRYRAATLWYAPDILLSPQTERSLADRPPQHLPPTVAVGAKWTAGI